MLEEENYSSTFSIPRVVFGLNRQRGLVLEHGEEEENVHGLHYQLGLHSASVLLLVANRPL